jgi:hypothetical protein
VTYCWTLNELFRAPLLAYRSASFPISIASSVIFASRKAVEVNALAMALASRNAAVRLFWPKLTPQVICVSEKVMFRFCFHTFITMAGLTSWEQ